MLIAYETTFFFTVLHLFIWLWVGFITEIFFTCRVGLFWTIFKRFFFSKKIPSARWPFRPPFSFVGNDRIVSLQIGCSRSSFVTTSTRLDYEERSLFKMESSNSSRVSVGFYWVLLSFTGFYWVLLGFTGFNRVLFGWRGLFMDFNGFEKFSYHPLAFLTGFTGF